MIREAVEEEARREDAGLPPRHRARKKHGWVLNVLSTIAIVFVVGALALTAWFLVSAAAVIVFFSGLILAAS